MSYLAPTKALDNPTNIHKYMISIIITKIDLEIKRGKMKCKYLKIRTKNYKKYVYCSSPNIKKEIEFKDCRNCRFKEYRQVKELKKKSKNLKKLEAKRYSIVTDNLTICYICQKRRKDDLHELFGGSNRRKSIEWGLVIPICRVCHSEWKTNEEMRKKYQEDGKQKFYKLYSKEKFLEEFGKNYI